MSTKKAKGFSILGYSGAAVKSWMGTLFLDSSGLEFKQQIPVLRQHEHDRVVGFGVGEIDPTHRFWVKGTFSDSTPDPAEVQKLIAEGLKFQASVGFTPLSMEQVEKDAEATVNGKLITGPAAICRKAHVGEVSIVPWGADHCTSVVALAHNNEAHITAERFSVFDYAVQELAGVKGGLPPGAQPKSFGEAIAHFTKKGHSIGEAGQMVMKGFPELYAAWVAQFSEDDECHGRIKVAYDLRR